MKKFIITLLALIFTLSIYAQDRSEHVDYGQGRSIGFALLGDPMVVGVGFKFVKDQNQIEINAGLSNSVVFNSSDNSLQSNNGLGISGGYNFFLGSKNKTRKSKVVKNYLSLKLGASFSNVNELKPTISWRREIFREEEQNYSRGFDLGLTHSRVIGDDRLSREDSFVDAYNSLFIRFDWNWFRPGK